MSSQVAPFGGKAGGISITDFPESVQETLKVFDADGSGRIQPGELALAGKMFEGEFPHQPTTASSSKNKNNPGSSDHYKRPRPVSAAARRVQKSRSTVGNRFVDPISSGSRRVFHVQSVRIAAAATYETGSLTTCESSKSARELASSFGRTFWKLQSPKIAEVVSYHVLVVKLYHHLLI